MFAYTIAVLVAIVLSVANAHMSIYVPSMWGSEPTNINSNWAVNPLENLDFNDWWMHGPKSLNDPPPASAVTQLPAGGTIDFEIGTNKAFTSMGRGLWHSPGKTSRVPPNPWSNTDSEWPSNLHAPARTDVSACALGIAYKSNVYDVKPEDFVIMSVAHDCVARALQAFDIPALPACPNGQCICAWFWIHNSIGGTDQNYMTAFQCNVTNPTKRVIGKPQAPVRCDGSKPCYLYPNWGNATTTCSRVQNPFYWANNQGNNIANPVNWQCAPTYTNAYGFVDGAQHNIFDDKLACIDNVVGDTLLSTGTNSISSNPSTLLATARCGSKLTVQGDGNVVFADVSSGKVYWASGTAGVNGAAPYKLNLQGDGNLVLYDAKGSSFWSSKTAGNGCAPYSLKIRDPMKLTLVDCNGEPLWSVAA